jgi:hypothetical protein
VVPFITKEGMYCFQLREGHSNRRRNNIIPSGRNGTRNSLSSSIHQCDKEIREKETDFSVCIADADWSKLLRMHGLVRTREEGG